MSSGTPDRREPGELTYDHVLGEAREVSGKALDRLRELGDQIPGGLVEQVERLHDDPLHDRRKAVRVGDEALPVAVASAGLSSPAEGAAVRDHCPTGLAVVLPCPAGVGTLLRVRLPPELGGGGWLTVEVRHCRKEGSTWVAGCELLGEQPPI